MKISLIIGTPRSGKSRVYDLLISSNNFSWVSEYHTRFNPNKLFVNLLNKIYSIPMLGYMLYRYKDKIKYLPHPIETNVFWAKNIRNFNKTDFNIDSQDLNFHKRYYTNLIERIFKYQNKKYFIAEYSKWGRIKLFTYMYPEAKFIHFVRDGKAVAYEYHKMITSGNYKEWQCKEEWIKQWPKNLKKEFKNNGETLIAFCALLWKYQINIIKEECSTLDKKNYLEVKYEDFVENPLDCLNQINLFLGVKTNKRLEKYIKLKKIVNKNNGWKSGLSEQDKMTLISILDS